MVFLDHGKHKKETVYLTSRIAEPHLDITNNALHDHQVFYRMIKLHIFIHQMLPAFLSSSSLVSIFVKYDIIFTYRARKVNIKIGGLRKTNYSSPYLHSHNIDVLIQLMRMLIE